MDPVKKMLDLSEKLSAFNHKSQDKKFDQGQKTKAIVELNKDSYLVVSMKN